MAPHDGDSDCRSDEDEDPVYATRSSATADVNWRRHRNNLSHLAPKIDKSRSIASLTDS